MAQNMFENNFGNKNNYKIIMKTPSTSLNSTNELYFVSVNVQSTDEQVFPARMRLHYKSIYSYNQLLSNKLANHFSQYRLRRQLCGPEKSDHISGATILKIYVNRNLGIKLFLCYITFLFLRH